MAKVLLVDTNFSSGPIYRELVSMGHDVHVVGNNPNDYLAKVSPNYWNVDYADARALGVLVDKHQYEFLVPGCTDRSYLSCVAVGRGRFPGVDRADAYEVIFNKGRFRQLADRLGLPIPDQLRADTQSTRRPVIIKPVDAFSGKGITVLHEADAGGFDQAVALARATSPSGDYLAESFMEGQLQSHSAFIEGGRVALDFLVQEDSSVNRFVVDTSRVVTDLSTSILAGLRHCAEAMAAELGLVDGLLHSQFISRGADFTLIETTRRCPGDLYSQLIELTTGYPYARSYVLPFLGKQVVDRRCELRREPIMRHTVTVSAPQSFAYLHFNTALRVEQWTPLSLAGDQLKPSPRSRIGILFCRAADAQDLDQIYRTTLRRDLYEVRA